ncbi:MAG: 50S ribosomal protein L29 [Bacteroidetes bacterium]|jgi:large subunit ribosomal protein L29|nr:50S ribosomal protein L29 [Bacteroidota bacterium]MBT6684844.1 50S ribosomal protein L29 [Bacteroidota bacterium]MBT7142538.1 50S ribosomal protein L29 [Bacteroidota bacterium]MBT7493235.1 50S ribosomal protein L29 [Bacteroidota bacterium]
MKNSEIRELTTKEVIERIDEEKSILSRQKLNHAVSPLDNPMKIKETRKNIAKLKTELQKRTLSETNK